MTLQAIAICAFFYLSDEHKLDIKPESVDLICKNAELIVEYSIKNNIYPELMLSLMWSESRFQTDVISNHGACGMMQIIPKWSDNKTCNQLKIPLETIIEGSRQLNFWISEYGKGSIEKGLCGYAAGYKCKESGKAKKYAKMINNKSKKLRNKINKLIILLSEKKEFQKYLVNKYKL